MAYVRLNPTNGCVSTRDPQVLEPGELVESSGIKLRKNDTVQLHADSAPSLLGSSIFVASPPRYLTFENGDSYIVFGGSAGYLKKIDPDTGIVNNVEDLGVSNSTEICAIHRGDEWFIGTDVSHRVINSSGDRPMGGFDAPTTLESFGLNEQAAVGSSTPDTEQYDVFTYFLTAYNSTYDVESEVFASNYARITNISGDRGYELEFSASPGLVSTIDGYISDGYFDKVKIYRHYWGRDSGSDNTNNSRANDNGNSVFKEGGLLDIIDIADAKTTYDDDIISRYDPSTPYPLTYLDPLQGGKLGRFLGAVRPFTLGALFQDCLVVNSPDTSKQAIRYSPPKQPEYQPEDYLMFFAGEGSDEVVGIHTVGSVCMVLTTGSTHRINYLPLGGRMAQGQGEAQEEITSRVGCVGREASTTVESERGELCVWLSHRGLEWSDGRRWSDACPDFQASDLGGSLSSSVLVADTQNYRVRLYNSGQVWDFYYHPSHLKNGKMKMMGPTSGVGTILGATRDTNGGVWLSQSAGIYSASGQTIDGTLTLGYLAGSQPFMDIRVTNVGLTHTAAPARDFRVKGVAKLRGEEAPDGSFVSIPNPELPETGRVEVDHLGQWYRQEIAVEGSGGWSAGPLWLDLEFEGGDSD